MYFRPSWAILVRQRAILEKGQAHFRENFRGCLFPHARGDPRFTPRKIFLRVLHPLLRLQSLHLLQPLCVLKTLPRPTASATLSLVMPTSAKFCGAAISRPRCPWLCPPLQKFAGAGGCLMRRSLFRWWQHFHHRRVQLARVGFARIFFSTRRPWPEAKKISKKGLTMYEQRAII